MMSRRTPPSQVDTSRFGNRSRRTAQAPRRLAFAVAIVAVIAGSPAHADTLRARVENRGAPPRIVNGVLTGEFPATGALLDARDGTVAQVICSGTLISCQTFLTAGHCVDGNLNPRDVSVFLQHAGFFKVTKIMRHPAYDFPIGDVAVLTLGAPVVGIRPAHIATDSAPAFGTVGTIVGFGRSGELRDDFGLKRSGQVITAGCVDGISDATSLCWTFAPPPGGDAASSNTCNCDSGGPLFVDIDGEPTLAGVTSGGTNAGCLPTDHSYDANVFTYSDWIAKHVHGDLAPSACGNLAAVGTAGTSVTTVSGMLDAEAREGRHTFDVPPGRVELRVTMNARDDGTTNFDLYVKHGAPPTTADFDCAQTGVGQFASCLFREPAAGSWYVLVNRHSGDGAYQVTASRFGIDCSVPANAAAPCDDGDACTTEDVCMGGSCAGVAAPDGAPCDDGRLCTAVDACVAGTCVGSTEPRTGCSASATGRGSLLLKASRTRRGGRLAWRWLAAAPTQQAAFGSPTTMTDYGLCLYEGARTAPSLLLEQHVPPGDRWRDVRTGFRYSDASLSASGVRSMALRARRDGRTKIVVHGRGAGMVPLPLAQQPTVTLQLVHAGACWEARYGTDVRNDVHIFRARPD